MKFINVKPRKDIFDILWGLHIYWLIWKYSTKANFLCQTVLQCTHKKISSIQLFSLKNNKYVHNFTKILSEKCERVDLHILEKREILSHRKKIREFYSLVFSLGKLLHSRNFCPKSSAENFRNYHTVIWRHFGKKNVVSVIWKIVT